MPKISVSDRIHIGSAEFDPDAVMRDFRCGLGGSAGAVVSFSGIVRKGSGQAAVDMLCLWQYEGFTKSRIEAFATVALERWPVIDLVIWHRYGEIRPGEVIVLVGVAALHRRAAFEAADFLMDHLKTEAPFWKQEIRGKDRVWIEPGEHDRLDRLRWSEG